MDFGLSVEHQMIQNSIREFCKGELDPIADEIDRGARFPIEVFEKAG
jgi:alkylation response protein AidB-like acyl-CoA dehydrogenase